MGVGVWEGVNMNVRECEEVWLCVYGDVWECMVVNVRVCENVSMSM